MFTLEWHAAADRSGRRESVFSHMLSIATSCTVQTADGELQLDPLRAPRYQRKLTAV